MKWLLWCRDWVLSWLRFSPKYCIRLVDGDLPSSLDKNTIYIVAEDGFFEHVSMLCPCGCADVVHLNLLPDERPIWKMENHAVGGITLYPSVWRKGGCRSHYWIRQGRVKWCRNDIAVDRSI